MAFDSFGNRWCPDVLGIDLGIMLLMATPEMKRAMESVGLVKI